MLVRRCLLVFSSFARLLPQRLAAGEEYDTCARQYGGRRSALVVTRAEDQGHQMAGKRMEAHRARQGSPATTHPSFTGASGSVNQKVDPCPGALSTPTCP